MLSPRHLRRKRQRERRTFAGDGSGADLLHERAREEGQDALTAPCFGREARELDQLLEALFPRHGGMLKMNRESVNVRTRVILALLNAATPLFKD